MQRNIITHYIKNLIAPLALHEFNQKLLKSCLRSFYKNNDQLRKFFTRYSIISIVAQQSQAAYNGGSPYHSGRGSNLSVAKIFLDVAELIDRKDSA